MSGKHLPNPLRPNHSLHPGPATAGVVSPACASGSIVTRRAYNACLRGPGELERCTDTYLNVLIRQSKPDLNSFDSARQKHNIWLW